MAVSPHLKDLIEDAPVDMEPTKPLFQLMDFDEVLNKPPKEFLVRGFLGKGDTAMIYGAAKSKKSFQVLDLIASIATGSTFAGMFDVPEPANVVYCYGEGQGGMSNRLRALDHKWKFTAEQRARMKFLPLAPGLYDPGSPRHIERFVEYMESLEGLDDFLSGGLLAIDTLARATQGGNENETADMQKMIDAFDSAKVRLECTGFLVHHENRGGQMRGNTTLPGALDAFFQSVPKSATTGYLRFDEAKDQGEFPNIGWELKVHRWAEDDGAENTAPYIEWTGIAEDESKNRPSDWREDAVSTVRLHCRGESFAKTLPQIRALMASGVTEKTFGPHLSACAKDSTSLIKSIIKNSTKEDGSKGKESLHFFWDYKQEGEL